MAFSKVPNRASVATVAIPPSPYLKTLVRLALGTTPLSRISCTMLPQSIEASWASSQTKIILGFEGSILLKSFAINFTPTMEHSSMMMYSPQDNPSRARNIWIVKASRPVDSRSFLAATPVGASRV